MMLSRIETGVEEQRRLIADAAHELRTPLAAMRAELGVSLLADDLGPEAEAVLRSTIEEVDRLSAIVNGLLTLAAPTAPRSTSSCAPSTWPRWRRRPSSACARSRTRGK
jgi:two-component system sensor histidine kinase QseC